MHFAAGRPSSVLFNVSVQCFCSSSCYHSAAITVHSLPYSSEFFFSFDWIASIFHLLLLLLLLLLHSCPLIFHFFFFCHWIQKETKKTKTDHFTSYFIFVSQFGVQCLLLPFPLLHFLLSSSTRRDLHLFLFLVICNAVFLLLFGNGYHCWPAAFHHQHFCCFQILFFEREFCFFSFSFAILLLLLLFKVRYHIL